MSARHEWAMQLARPQHGESRHKKHFWSMHAINKLLFSNVLVVPRSLSEMPGAAHICLQSSAKWITFLLAYLPSHCSDFYAFAGKDGGKAKPLKVKFRAGVAL